MFEPWVIVGVGSPHGDDQIGWCVAQLLAEQFEAGELELQLLTRPVSQLWTLLNSPRLLIIDACLADLPTATLRRITLEQLETQSTGLLSSHSLGVAELLTLAKGMGMQIDHLRIFGIQLLQTEPMAELSPQLKVALPRIVDQLVAEINAY